MNLKDYLETKTRPLVSYSIQLLSRQMLSEIKIKEDAEKALSRPDVISQGDFEAFSETLKYSDRRISDYKEAIQLLIEAERKNALKNINPASYGMPKD